MNAELVEMVRLVEAAVGGRPASLKSVGGKRSDGGCALQPDIYFLLESRRQNLPCR